MSSRRWVLDTNVVIDWLVFNDPYMDPLRNAVHDGSLTILTHPPAIDELHRVLGYRQLKLDAARRENVFQQYISQTVCVSLPSGACNKGLQLPGGFPRCRDRDDEPFLALAYHQRTDALVSRDNAVYGLKSRAAGFGLCILNVQQAISALSA